MTTAHPASSSASRHSLYNGHGYSGARFLLHERVDERTAHLSPRLRTATHQTLKGDFQRAQPFQPLTHFAQLVLPDASRDRAALTSVERKKRLNVVQRETQSLGALDEAQPPQSVSRVPPDAPNGALRLSEKSPSLVVADRLYVHSCSGRELSDCHRGHGRLYPYSGTYLEWGMDWNCIGRRNGAMTTMFAGTAAAVGASACCAGPLLLVMLGVGGAWGSRLVALQAYQPFFVAAALASFGFAFHRLYLRSEACELGTACSTPPVRQRQRVAFWVLSLTAAALMLFPLYAPLFLQ